MTIKPGDLVIIANPESAVAGFRGTVRRSDQPTDVLWVDVRLENAPIGIDPEIPYWFRRDDLEIIAQKLPTI